MNLPDSFYIALCMTVLLVGAVYWVWTQIQFVQRKVNMLENIVYELKTLCSRPPDTFLPSMSSMPSDPLPTAPATSYPPAPPSELGDDEDLLHETFLAEVDTEEKEVDPIVADFEAHMASAASAAADEETPVEESTPTFVLQEEPEIPRMFQDNDASSSIVLADELQPGGVGSGVIGGPSALDSMSLKELRRLAQQRGISGSSDLRKKDLIAAIKALPVDPLSFDA